MLCLAYSMVLIFIPPNPFPPKDSKKTVNTQCIYLEKPFKRKLFCLCPVKILNRFFITSI